VSLGEDLGLNVSWSCDAVAEGNVAYSWLKNDQVTQFEVITFPFNQHAGNNFTVKTFFMLTCFDCNFSIFSPSGTGEYEALP